MIKCAYCSNLCVKAGIQKNGVQKFLCRLCRKYQQANYMRKAWQAGTRDRICLLVREGLSMRGIARIMNIALSTVIRKIREAGEILSKPVRWVSRHVYEIDELWTFVGKKSNEVWVMYAFDRTAKEVVNFQVGARTKENLRTLTDQAMQENPKRICTDGLNVYPNLIPAVLHSVGLSHTRHIERHNLNLRMHLKRLSRKTICYSKSKEMLEACLKIYFWGGSVAHGIDDQNGTLSFAPRTVKS